MRASEWNQNRAWLLLWRSEGSMNLIAKGGVGIGGQPAERAREREESIEQMREKGL